MLDCSFSLQIWSVLLDTLSPSFELPSSTASFSDRWLQRYLGPPPKNKIIRAAWLILPKIIYSQIWLEQNKRIFRNYEQDVKLVVVKIKCQLKECLRDLKDDLNLTQQDKKWGSSLDLQLQKLAKSIPLLKVWQIRVTENELQGWIAN